MTQEPLDKASLKNLFQRRVHGVLTPLENFICKQAQAGAFLVLAILLALLNANAPWGGWFERIAQMNLGVHLAQWSFDLTIFHWISDALLALFFFLVGLEIKRDMLVGTMRNPKQAVLVLMAALGGMILPASFYWMLNHGGTGQAGWAIPMTTDTAFAIGVMALLARHVSLSASLFLTALAIIDDIVTIAVIAIFYTRDLHLIELIKACAPLGLLFLANAMGIQRGAVYFVLGVLLWWFIRESGIHPTLAGLLAALAVPAKAVIGQHRFIEKIKYQMLSFEKQAGEGKTILKSDVQHELAGEIGDTVKSALTPLQRWHSTLENPIAIIVLPIFALFNAGIPFSEQNFLAAVTSPISWGIVLGLVIGKPLGIALFGLLSIKLRIAKMPQDMFPSELIGAGILAGIGFTMSVFIALLAFSEQDLLNEARMGILFSSILAAVLGGLWLFHKGRKHRKQSFR